MASGLTRVNRVRWHIFDGRDQVVGRLAQRVSQLIIGKHKPTFSPHLDHGDNVVVVNADKLVLTGQKYEKKLYRWHTGYPGGLRSITPRELVERKDKPEEILKRAVSGMLPKNKLRKARLRRLKVYRDETNPHWEQFSPADRIAFENRRARYVPPPKNQPGIIVQPLYEETADKEERQAALEAYEKLSDEVVMPELPAWEFDSKIHTLEEAAELGVDLEPILRAMPEQYWHLYPEMVEKYPHIFQERVDSK